MGRNGKASGDCWIFSKYECKGEYSWTSRLFINDIPAILLKVASLNRSSASWEDICVLSAIESNLRGSERYSANISFSTEPSGAAQSSIENRWGCTWIPCPGSPLRHFRAEVNGTVKNCPITVSVASLRDRSCCFIRRIVLATSFPIIASRAGNSSRWLAKPQNSFRERESSPSPSI